MRCPIDGSELKITDRQGIEIDYCPQCRGVWLDRGELDKIIERTCDTFATRTPEPAQPPRQTAPTYRDDEDDDYRQQPQNQTQYKKKKRGSFLEDLFDFG